MSDGTNSGWHARNKNSIKLRTSDGKRSAVQVRTVETTLTPEQIEAGLARRAAAKQALEETAAKQKTRDEAKLRAKKADEKHAAGRHSPGGWRPANQRKDFDPFAKQNDPRRRK